MESAFRPLTPYERELLEKLLEPKFPGRDELRRQLQSVSAKQVLDDGTLALRYGGDTVAPVSCRVPTEAECADIDGDTIHILLHVVSGAMNELEIFKFGSARVFKRPAPDELIVFTPHGVAGVNPKND